MDGSTDQLFEEKWVALRADQHARQSLRGDDRHLVQRTREQTGIGRGQRCQPETLEVQPHLPRGFRSRPEGHEHQAARRSRMGHNRGQEIQRTRVRPVQILNHHDQRCRACRKGHEMQNVLRRTGTRRGRIARCSVGDGR